MTERQANARSNSPAALWELICAFWACAGWALSAIHQLNRGGYTLALLLGIGLLWVVRRINPDAHGGCATRTGFARLIRRLRHPFPAAFAVLTALVLAGGALHPPGNYDGLAYRTPRVLNWLAEGRWHWIHTEFNRLNNRACGYEWVTAPLISLTGSDRLQFLINVVSFILLPGLVFSVFWRLGLSRKTAWYWMWLAPTGYCFVLQAGSIGNDLFGVPFALAAVDFALRARASGRASEAWLSIVAAALLTGSKANNIPLLLPWLFALWPCVGLLRSRFAATFLVCAFAALASYLPSAALNQHYCGDWSGLVAEHNQSFQAKPALRVANNTVLMLIQNLAPPVFPMANAWNGAVERAVPASLRHELENNFEPGAAHWTIGELEIEEGAGLGFGVTGLAIVSAVVGLARYRRGRVPHGHCGFRPEFFSNAILISAWIALLALMAKSGITGISRIAAAFYPLCLAGVLAVSNQAVVAGKRWWRNLGLLVFALGAAVVILSPARPLWPWRLVLGEGANDHFPSSLARARSVYDVQSRRADGFAPVREVLPPGLKVLGLISFDDPETSLWRPFGSRRIVHVTRSDTPQALRASGIEYILVNATKFDWIFDAPLDAWMIRMHAEKVAELSLPLRSTLGPSRWVLVRLGAANAPK
jgi:hypothetical protein